LILSAGHVAGQALQTYEADPTLSLTRVHLPDPPAPPSRPSLPWRVFVTADGVPVLANHADAPWPTASTGKIMTAYVVLHDPGLPLSRRITITRGDVAQEYQGYLAGDSEIPLTEGETFTVRDLLYALLLPSADDAADVLARASTYGSRGFLLAMNRTARYLGLRDSHFTDPSGADPSNVSSPRDLVLLTEAALMDPTFVRIVSTRTYRFPHVGLIGNLNWMLWNVPGAFGVKTGWTTPAGHALVFAVRRPVFGETVTVVGAIMGVNDGSFAPTFHMGAALSDYAFRDLYPLTLPRGPIGTLHWGDGVVTRVYAPISFKVVLPRGTAPSLSWQTTPISARGTPLLAGTATLRDGGVVVARLPLLSTPPPAWYRDLYAVGRLLAKL
jgi:D-alanyl-D-alanine carboxypeptidase